MLALLTALSLPVFAQPAEVEADGPVEDLPEVYSFSHKTGQLAAFVFESADTENSGRSHHHVVVATRWSGRMQWGDGAQCQGEFKVAVSGLSADDPVVRKAEAVGDALSEQDRTKVNAHMRSRDQLFADRFPEISYVVKGCQPGRGGGRVIVGDFSLRGITREVAFLVDAEDTDGQLHLKGEGSITHTAFGFEPYYALFGQRQNQDRMQIRLDVRGVAVGAGASVRAPLIEAAD